MAVAFALAAGALAAVPAGTAQAVGEDEIVLPAADRTSTRVKIAAGWQSYRGIF